MTDKTLHIVLEYKWYDFIESGKKFIEYRAMSDYWNKRLKNKDYNFITFHKGYTSTTMTFRIKTIFICNSKNNDLGISPVWAIRFDERIINE